jgi:hypothetical protein
MIAQNLAQAALAAGFTVRFSTLAAALADLLAQESLPVISDNYFCRSTTIRFAGSSMSGQPR